MTKDSKRAVKVSSSSRRIVTAIAQAIIPSEGPDRPGAEELELVDRLIEWLSTMRGAPRAFILVCRLWEFSPFLKGKFSRFSRLPLEQRTEVLEKFERSRFYLIRMAFLGLKAVFMASFYNTPRVWPLIKYEEGCLSPLPKREPGDGGSEP